jgi:hypothetical protein
VYLKKDHVNHSFDEFLEALSREVMRREGGRRSAHFDSLLDDFQLHGWRGAVRCVRINKEISDAITIRQGR